MEKEKNKDKEKVSYHLQIATKIKSASKKLSSHLDRDEVIANSDITLTNEIKNLGDNKFPGGKVSKIDIVCIPGVEELRWSWVDPSKIPEILPGKSIDWSETVNLSCPFGIFCIRFQILVDQKAEIVYHMGPNQRTSKDTYMSTFFVAVDRRQVETTVLLDQILKELKKKG